VDDAFDVPDDDAFDVPDHIACPKKNRKFGDRFASYYRDPGMRIPFFMTIVGSRYSGKSTFIEDIMSGDVPGLKFDFDQYIYASPQPVDNPAIKTTSYDNLVVKNYPGHNLLICDDPPVDNNDYRRFIIKKPEGVDMKIGL